VVKLVRAGMSEEIVLNMVKTQPAKFAIGADQLIELKNAGVSERIINTMVLREKGASIASPSGTVKIPNRTAVKLVMTKALSSGTAQAGEVFNLAVDEDVRVDGNVVIAKGALAAGRITAVKKRVFSGGNGMLEITVDSAKAVDGQDVPLKATITKDGGEAGFGRTGKNVEMPQGFSVNAVVDGEKEVKLRDTK
jgi:hypothetical protein